MSNENKYQVICDTLKARIVAAYAGVQGVKPDFTQGFHAVENDRFY